MPQSRQGLAVGSLCYLVGTAESLSCRVQMCRGT